MQKKINKKRKNWEKSVTQTPVYKFADSIKNIGGDINNDPNYLRGLGWLKQDNQEIPPEWSYSIVQLTISGKGILMHHGIRYELPSGTGFIAHSTDSAVSYHNPCEDQQPWNFLYLEFFGESMRNFVSEVCETQSPCFNFSPTNDLILELSALQHFSDKRVNISAGDQQLLCGKIRKLVIDGLSNQRRLRNRTVEKALEILDQEEGSIITVNELAKRLKISREYLSREFKKTVKSSPYQYILRKRLSAAVALINNSSLSIKEIAFRLGFSSTTTFGRQFKQTYGASPSSLRRN